MVRFFSLLVFVSISFFGSAPVAVAEETSDKLEKFVAKLPRGSLGIPFYWLEMNSAVGWESMILVFGYANNKTVCARLKSLATEDAPFRKFRCKSAN